MTVQFLKSDQIIPNSPNSEAQLSRTDATRAKQIVQSVISDNGGIRNENYFKVLSDISKKLKDAGFKELARNVIALRGSASTGAFTDEGSNLVDRSGQQARIDDIVTLFSDFSRGGSSFSRRKLQHVRTKRGIGTNGKHIRIEDSVFNKVLNSLINVQKTAPGLTRDESSNVPGSVVASYKQPVEKGVSSFSRKRLSDQNDIIQERIYKLGRIDAGTPQFKKELTALKNDVRAFTANVRKTGGRNLPKEVNIKLEGMTNAIKKLEENPDKYQQLTRANDYLQKTLRNTGVISSSSTDGATNIMTPQELFKRLFVDMKKISPRRMVELRQQAKEVATAKARAEGRNEATPQEERNELMKQILKNTEIGREIAKEKRRKGGGEGGSADVFDALAAVVGTKLSNKLNELIQKIDELEGAEDGELAKIQTKINALSQQISLLGQTFNTSSAALKEGLAALLRRN